MVITAFNTLTTIQPPATVLIFIIITPSIIMGWIPETLQLLSREQKGLKIQFL